MIRTVLFDLDGTLLDSSPGILTCMHYGLNAVGVVSTDAAILELIGVPLQDMFARLGTPRDRVDVGVAAYRDLYSQGEMFNCVTFDGIAAPTVEHFGMAQEFEFVAGATIDGSRRHKADVIAYALGELGVDAKDVVMIGDRSEDLLGGHQNGTASIGVTWGFGTREELEACEPFAVVDTAAELSKALARL